MDYGLIATVASAILAVISYYYNRQYRKSIKLMQDLAKAFSDTAKAFADGKLSPQEAETLSKDWSEIAEEVDLTKIAKKLEELIGR